MAGCREEEERRRKRGAFGRKKKEGCVMWLSAHVYVPEVLKRFRICVTIDA